MSVPRLTTLALALLLAGAPLWLTACGSDDPSEPPPPPEPATIREVVESTGWFPETLPDSSGYAVTRFDSTGAAGDLACTGFLGQEILAVSELTMLAATSDRQYPGAILQWGSIANLAPDPVLSDRAAGELVLTTPGGQEVTGTVGALDPATVEAWRLDALAQLEAPAPAPWQVQVDAIHGLDHLAVSAGVAPAGLTTTAADRLAGDDPSRGRALVRLWRPVLSVAAPYPGTAAGAFAPDVTGDDLADQMAPGNPPVWMERVTWGQLVLIAVEADAVFATVAEAAAASFPAVASGEEPPPGATSVWDLQGVEIRVFALGADAGALEAAAAAGPTALAEALASAPADLAALPPVTAHLLALRNGGPITVPLAAEFAYRTCDAAPDVFDRVLWRLAAADAQTVRRAGDLRSNAGGRYFYDGGTEQFVEEEVLEIPDLDGDGGVARPGARRPFVHRDLLPGHAVLEFYELQLSQGTLRSRLRFDGSSLVGRSYTVFLVCAQPMPAVRITYTTPQGQTTAGGRNEVGHVIHGTDNGQLRMLRLGYRQRRPQDNPSTFDDIMYFSHNPDHVAFAHTPAENFRIYAFRFELDDTTPEGGMSVFVDGELLEQDTTDNRALQAFVGATLGPREVDPDGDGEDVRPFTTFWLAEVVAYAGAGTDAEILAETERLRQFYGLDR